MLLGFSSKHTQVDIPEIIISIGATIVASAIVISVVIVMSAFAIVILYSVVSSMVDKIREVLKDGKRN